MVCIDKLKKQFQTVTVVGYSKIIEKTESKCGSTTSRFLFQIIRIVALYTPLTLINLFPKSICTIFGSCALDFSDSQNRCFSWANRALNSKFIGHQKAGFFIKSHFIFNNYSGDNMEKLFKSLIHENRWNKNVQHFYFTWVFHNGSQQMLNKLISKKIRACKDLEEFTPVSSVRYLPEHTTNMGHLGMLFLYGNYYRNIDPKRHIVIWPDLSPNKYYLNELIKIYPLEVTQFAGAPNLSNLNLIDIDTLTYSRVKKDKWRLEAPSTLPSDQDFPELYISNEFKLKSDENLNELAHKKLEKIGFDSNKWFVILHIKENYLGYNSGGEVRDAEISTFNSVCKLILDLGGQVIRMGGKNFPRLDEDFPAIDYAHAGCKSEILDFWLWSNCKFWIGNNNGAAVAVIPFGKPRLITNQWPILPSGPESDFFIPKIFFDQGKEKIISPEELIHSKYSRAMKKSVFEKNQIKVINNSSKLLVDSTLEFYQNMEIQTNTYQYSNSKYTNQVYEAMNCKNTSPLMKIPLAFTKHYEELEFNIKSNKALEGKYLK